MTNSWNLDKVKKFLTNFADDKSNYCMIIINKETKYEGYAIISKDKKIVVFDENNNGIMCSQKDFKSKYQIEDLIREKSNTTIEDIEMDLCELDTEYREALAKILLKQQYISDTPLNLQYGTERQQKELERVWKKPLKSKQICEIINGIRKEMQGDFQYGQFAGIASYYINIAKRMEKLEKIKKGKTNNTMEAR